MTVQALARAYNRVVDALSFGSAYHKMRRLLNERIDSPESIQDFPPSHPAGFVRELKKRRIGIVESYLTIVRSLESGRHQERIRALRLLEEQAFHSKNLTMPLNTARVQMALMKEAIKSRDNKRRQLELLHDFTVSAYGQPSVIRGCLDQLGIIELPETGARIADLGAGWDPHVHDNSSYGRKTPSQLVIDAFIKGISEITVAFDDLHDLGNVEELLEAGALLGVRVGIGVEFSVRACGQRFHFLFELPRLGSGAELRAFLDLHQPDLEDFFYCLDRNRESRLGSIRELIDHFNAAYLRGLNEGHPAGSMYALPPLDLAHAGEIAPLRNINRLLLGEVLYASWKPVLLRRVLLARSRLADVQDQWERGAASRGELDAAARRYGELRDEYTGLNPEELRARFFSEPRIADYPTVFTDLAGACAPLRAAGGTIRILHPLEHGLEAACRVVLACREWLDHVEVYNMYDGIERPPDDLIRFSRFINALNGGRSTEVTRALEECGVSPVEPDLAESVRRAVSGPGGPPLVPMCGSDSTGRSTTIPGMGFIFSSRLQGPNRQRYRERHFALPPLVSRIIAAGGTAVDPEGGDAQEPAARSGRRHRAGDGPDSVISMGKSEHFTPNRIGDETEVTPVPFFRALRYLNPWLLNVVFVGAGFVVATLALGWQYALLWFGITTLRHVVVDLVARQGHRVTEWTLKEVDFRNIARSLFWTGVSVPLLALVSLLFDRAWPAGVSGHAYQFAKYFLIGAVNGLYLVAHNTLRGFGKGVTRANLFRALISWPFASLFAPLLDLLAVPSIVQAKLWSDLVGGVIEGSGKFIRSVRLTRRDLSEILPDACARGGASWETGVLDLLYIFGRETRSRDSLREILFGKRNLLERAEDFLRGSRGRPQPRLREYQALRSVFEDGSAYPRLSDFVILHYRQEWAVLLVDLLSRQFFAFRAWLVREGARGTREGAWAARGTPAARGTGGTRSG